MLQIVAAMKELVQSSEERMFADNNG